ncbi:ABC transporter ATP-binding protein [Paenibacillus thalictri]|uniref:ABC transporter ATP-binding protein n=1 Tax=Paenibacillus thalictri TaxID=2527873 RepID=A0A4Q9DWQ3_9BACL|nr:ABC transporter ATP-binding protein [Paenibacillus thalictri]TBL81517.1 ABC transporter ATP-binding protein [Paenibacillus thalictri]
MDKTVPRHDFAVFREPGDVLAAASPEAVLEVEGLHTHFETEGGTVRAVNGVSFTLAPGERMAIVGESGSGKSAMAMSLIRLVSYPGNIVSGSIRFAGKDLLKAGEREMNRLRGGDIGTVFQDPMTSLDPVMKIEDQMVLPIRRHLGLSAKEASVRAAELLAKVGIPDPQARLRQYPFELSGGMRQRVLIAMAIACNPKLIIADEPTTALDVTIQAQIVELLKQLTSSTGSAMLFITHDLGLVARFAHRVAVMYAGKIVETGQVEDVFLRPQHPYTQSLLRTIPSMTGPKPARLLQIEGLPPDMRHPVSGCAFKERCAAAQGRCSVEAPELLASSGEPSSGQGHLAACWVEGGLSSVLESREEDELFTRFKADAASDTGRPDLPDFEEGEDVLSVQGLRKQFLRKPGLPWKPAVKVQAVNGIDLRLRRGETIGLVGESGCGKSTTARLLLHLEEPTGGTIAVNGEPLTSLQDESWISYRKRVQMVFQDPYASFNPKMTVSEIICEPLDVMKIGTRPERQRKAYDLIQKVGLDPAYLSRFPSQLSGGQRQRVGIARALALSPDVIVADEPTSALDVSVRAQVINLLSDLKNELGISFIFISHDLSTVRYISDKIAVMYLGEIVEIGPSEDVFQAPMHPYTSALLAAVPIPDPVKERSRSVELLTGDLPSPANPPAGCAFSSRCPMASIRCREEKPALVQFGERKAACHYAHA